MQGTLVMLVALSGLGCHNKGCEIAYAPPTYMGCFGGGGGYGYGGCYADVYPGPAMPACYAGCYGGCYSGCYGCYGMGYAGCYSGGYGGCYGGGCYGGWYGGCYGAGYAGCGHRRNRCGGGGGGLFHCRKRSSCNTCAYVEPMCNSCGYGYGGAYAPAVFGSAVGMSYPSMPSSQSLTVPSKQYGTTTGQSMMGTTTMPSEMAPPVPANPVTPSTTAPGVPATSPSPELPVEPATPPAPRPVTPAVPRVPAT